MTMSWGCAESAPFLTLKGTIMRRWCDLPEHLCNCTLCAASCPESRWVQCGEKGCDSCKNSQCSYSVTYVEGSQISGEFFEDVSGLMVTGWGVDGVAGRAWMKGTDEWFRVELLSDPWLKGLQVKSCMETCRKGSKKKALQHHGITCLTAPLCLHPCVKQRYLNLIHFVGPLLPLPFVLWGRNQTWNCVFLF